MTDNQQELLKEETVAEESKDITATVGEILKHAREASGLTIEDISGRLHLRPSLVRDIEADKFDGISSATYARGYVRNYARILGVDEAEVMACLEQQVPSEAEPAMQSFSRKTTHQARDSRLMMVTWLIVIVLAALVVLWWFQKSNMNTGMDLSQPSAEEVAAAVELGATEAGEPVISTASVVSLPLIDEEQSEPVQTETPDAAETTPASELVPTETATESSATATVPEQSQPQPEDAVTASLNVSLAGDCWMKVEDATGKVLISGVKEAGRSMDVTGVAPFSLVIGAPQVVSLQFNGENISLEDYPAGKVARLSLPRE